MKPLPSLRPRERRLALMAAMVLLSWGVVSLVVQPLWDRVHELQLHVDTQLEKLEAVNRLLAQEPSVVRRHHVLASHLHVESDEGSLLHELEALSSQSKLTLNLKPHPLKAEDHVSRLEVELDVEGSQEKLLAFLDALLGLPRLVAIERLRISSIPTKEHQLRASLLIQQLTLR